MLLFVSTTFQLENELVTQGCVQALQKCIDPKFEYD